MAPTRRDPDPAIPGAPVRHLADLQPGDLVFYDSPLSHVSTYIGNGQMVHASAPAQPAEVVSVDSMSGVVAMRRIA